MSNRKRTGDRDMGRPKPKYSFYDSSDKAHSFINPYTFVRLDTTDKSENNSAGTQSINPAALEDDEEIVTGKLTCHLYLRTPLIIPDSDSAVPDSKNEKHLYYPFMRIDGNCMIPGSSIRGPVRSMYETITNSCFSTMQYQQKITARTKGPFLPGLLFYKDGAMKLIAAERYRIRMDPKDLSEAKKPDAECASYSREELLRWGYGAHLSFEGKTNTLTKNRREIEVYYVKQIKDKLAKADVDTLDKTKQALDSGYLYIGEPFSKKHYESIFVPKSEEKTDNLYTHEVVKNAYINMKTAVDEYQNGSVNRNWPDKHKGYRHINFEKFESGQIQAMPVWYMKDSTVLYLSPACIGRFTYHRTMEDIVPNHKSCNGSEPLCKACSLFGMIKKNQENSMEDESGGYGSRLRFGDAKLIEPSTPEQVSNKLKKITLAELSSPKPSYLPFYLNSSDYTKGYDAEGATIKGRKFYWHHYPDLKVEQKKSERNATVQYFLNPAVFEFTVYFDDITKRQLRELEYVLCLGENNQESDLCYKIGHGKPLGYGSVKICVVSEEIRSFDKENYNIVKSVIDTGLKDKVPELVQEWPAGLNTVLSYSYIDTKMSQVGFGVRYPFVANETEEKDVKKIEAIDRNALASHQWFSNNYLFGKKEPKMYLADTPVKDDISKIALPALKLIDIVGDNGVSFFSENAEDDACSGRTSQKSDLKKGDVITVQLLNINSDNKEPGLYFGRFKYNGMRGCIKSIPQFLSKGTMVEVHITNPKTKNGEIFTEFVRKQN